MPANDKRVVKVNRRSGYDKHFRNTLTANVGTLVPILVDELCPDSKVNLKINVAASLPPLISDTYMNVRLRVEAFAVPHRLCQANYEEFFSDFAAKYIEDFDPTSDAPVDKPYIFSDDMNACMPLITLGGDYANISNVKALIGNGSLADYMGLCASLGDGDPDYEVVVAPFVAYHLIWQEWYRNPRVQRPAFSPLNASVTSHSSNIIVGDVEMPCAASLPFTRYYFGDGGEQPTIVPLDPLNFDVELGEYILADGKNILELRQRNFGLDFFTAAMVEPQQGPAAVVKFGENGDPADGFSIASLRAQNSLQQFRERNNLTSPRYQQQIYARYGCAPSDGIIQRPILIGAATYDVYSHGVVTTAASEFTGGPDSDNFNYFGGAVGTRQGNGFASGSDFIISGFHTKEPMYLIVLASLVPEVSYSQNMNMIFNRYKGLGSITDMANPILQNVGPQPIPVKFVADDSTDPDAVFAYTDRYSDWMFKNNEIHGDFKFGATLDGFVAQRHFGSEPEFGSSFLTIPTNYLDDVMQYTSSTLHFGYWMDCLLEYKVSMPLQEYAIPSLQDPGYEHGKTIVLRKNGQLL